MRKIYLISLLLSFVYITSSEPLCVSGFECYSDCEKWNGTQLQLPCGFGYLCRDNEVIKRCPGGSYCPSPQEKFTCPKGKYCVESSVKPVDCPPMSTCNKGSDSYIFWGAFIIATLGAIYYTALYYAYKNRAFFLSLLKIFPQSNEDANVKVNRDTIDISFQDLEVTIGSTKPLLQKFSPSKVILSGASGDIRNGTVTSIMGPSGAGKTTLMSVLLGKVEKSNGTIYINGKPENILKYKKSIGFVPQDDIMIRTLTVRQVIEHSALVRLPSSWSYTQKMKLVEDTISALGLSHVQNSVIGDELVRGVSGGERRRVSIAIELVAAPSVLFLDEPTSGLDSTSSKNVMLHMRNIAQKFRIPVVAVLHQPRSDIFPLLDELILLGRGGRTVYSGAADKALHYFHTIGFEAPSYVNPTDFFMDVISGHIKSSNNPNFVTSDLFDLWKKNMSNSTLSNNSSTVSIRHTPNFFAQVVYFMRRAMIQQLSSFSTRILDYVMYLLAGVIIGIAFFADGWYLAPVPLEYVPYCPPIVRDLFCVTAQKDNIGRAGVYIDMAIGVVSVTIATRTFSNEKVNYWRESSSGINRLAYFIAKNIVDLESMLVNTLVMLAAFFFVCSPRGNFGDYYLALILLQFCFYAMAYIVSFIFPYATLFSIISALLTGLGTGAPQSIENMGPISNVAWSRWWGEAYFILELREDDFLHPQQQQLSRVHADARYTYDLDNYSFDLSMMLVIGILLRVLAFIAMVFMNRKQQK